MKLPLVSVVVERGGTGGGVVGQKPRPGPRGLALLRVQCTTSPVRRGPVVPWESPGAAASTAAEERPPRGEVCSWSVLLNQAAWLATHVQEFEYYT